MSAKHDGENEPGYWRTHVASCRKIFAKVHGRTFVVKRRFVVPSARTQETGWRKACRVGATR
jgi:hypothetical protein